MSLWGTFGRIARAVGELLGGLLRGSKRTGSGKPEPVAPPPEDTHEQDNREIDEKIERGDL